MILTDRKTFGISAENPTGARNGGTHGKDCEKLHAAVEIHPGETYTLCDIDGPGMITNMWFGGATLYHSMILRFYWDDCDYPSAEVPGSAFFGYPYENIADNQGKYPILNSEYLLVTGYKGGNCYFEMPFKKHCRITIENRSREVRRCYYMISGWKGELPEGIGYFHAAYRQEHPVTKGRSYVVLDNVKGKGRFLGSTFAVGVNGMNCCWCEGETKMWLDGEEYPSMNYTGLEDYFGGSGNFGDDAPLAYYQTYCGRYVGLHAVFGTGNHYDNQLRLMMYRWHVKDEINFNESFKMVHDDFAWESGPRYDDFTSCAYYYLEEPSPVPFELPSDFEMKMK